MLGDSLLSKPKEWKCPVCREPLHQWMGNLVGATVRIERFDRDEVRLFVLGVMASDDRPMSAEARETLRALGTSLLRDAASDDEDSP
jgi:hypothetical protein